MSKQWFETWFDSPYYPVLYRHRDENEAAAFLDLLIAHLQIPVQTRVLDVACGRGRHALHLHRRGFRVTGFDLSEMSIREASKHEAEGLHFEVRDMRIPFEKPEWDLVLNLFTSFGYSDSDEDSLLAMRAMASALVPGGTMVLDYLEPGSVHVPDDLEKSVPEIEVAGAYRFEIRKFRDSRFVYKDIRVQDGDKVLQFREKVRLFTRDEMLDMAQKSGLELREMFGDYQLNPWTENSHRQIYRFYKPQL